MASLFLFAVFAAFVAISLAESTSDAALSTLVRSDPDVKCPLQVGKKFVGCNHKPSVVNFKHVGKLLVSVKVENARVRVRLSPSEGTAIFRAGTSAFKVGAVPPSPGHAQIHKSCNGFVSVSNSEQIVDLKAPNGKPDCCKKNVFVSVKVTLCTKKFDTCSTKTFVRSVKIICVNVCRGEGKHKMPVPMSRNMKCPSCVDKAFR